MPLVNALLMGGVIAYRQRRTPAETVPAAAFLQILLVYVSGLALDFMPGIVLILAFSAVSLGYSVYYLFSPKHRPGFLKTFASPGIYFLILSVPLAYVICRDRYFVGADDLTHWALAVKNYLYFNDFPARAINTDPNMSYPPATGLWLFLAGRLGRGGDGHVLSEAYYLLMQNCLCALYLLPFFRLFMGSDYTDGSKHAGDVHAPLSAGRTGSGDRTLRDDKQQNESFLESTFRRSAAILGGVALFMLPYLMMPKGAYIRLYADIPLSFLCVFLLAGFELDYHPTTLFMGFAVLALTKPAGQPLAVLLAVLFIYLKLPQWRGEKTESIRRTPRWVYLVYPALLGLTALAAGLSWSLWGQLGTPGLSLLARADEAIHAIETVETEGSSVVSRLTQSLPNLADPSRGPGFYKTVLINLLKASFRRGSMHFDGILPMSYGVLILLALAALIIRYFMRRRREEKETPPEDRRLFGILLVSFFYDCFLYISYVLFFSTTEAIYTASLDRYLMPSVLLILYGFYRMFRGPLVRIHIMLPSAVALAVVMLSINMPAYEQLFSDKPVMEHPEDLEVIRSIDPEPKAYYGLLGVPLDLIEVQLKRFYYETMPGRTPLDGAPEFSYDGSFSEKSREEFLQALRTGGYPAVFLSSYTEDPGRYAFLFEDGRVPEVGRWYRVVIDGKVVRLEAME